MVLPLRMLTSRGHWGPRNSNHTFRAAENQHHLLPGEGSSHEGSIQAKTKLMEQGSLLTTPPCCQGLDDQYRYSWHRTWHLAQAQDLPLPIPSRIPLTFSQGPWKATIKETRILGYKQYKRNMPASGDTASGVRVNQSLWLKMAVRNNFLLRSTRLNVNYRVL